MAGPEFVPDLFDAPPVSSCHRITPEACFGCVLHPAGLRSAADRNRVIDMFTHYHGYQENCPLCDPGKMYWDLSDHALLRMRIRNRYKQRRLFKQTLNLCQTGPDSGHRDCIFLLLPGFIDWSDMSWGSRESFRIACFGRIAQFAVFI
jgi:hypothetical protein